MMMMMMMMKGDASYDDRRRVSSTPASTYRGEKKDKVDGRDMDRGDGAIPSQDCQS
jgi:hypothetical protein